jgi:hypothetical protein
VKKDEVLKVVNELEDIPYFEGNPSYNLIKKFCYGIDENDSCFESLTETFVKSIIDLLIDSYSEKDLLEWLSQNDYNPFNNFNYAEFYNKYDVDEEEWEEMKDDCLMYDEVEEIICQSW